MYIKQHHWRIELYTRTTPYSYILFAFYKAPEVGELTNIKLNGQNNVELISKQHILKILGTFQTGLFTKSGNTPLWNIRPIMAIIRCREKSFSPFFTFCITLSVTVPKDKEISTPTTQGSLLGGPVPGKSSCGIQLIHAIWKPMNGILEKVLISQPRRRIVSN